MTREECEAIRMRYGIHCKEKHKQEQTDKQEYTEIDYIYDEENDLGIINFKMNHEQI